MKAHELQRSRVQPGALMAASLIYALFATSCTAPPPPVTPTRATAPEKPVRPLVTHVQKGVELRAKGEQWRPLAAGVMVKQGANLRTSARSEADVKLAESTGIKLDENTEVTITTLKKEKGEESLDTMLDVLRGRVYIKTRKTKRRTQFRLRTPTGLIVVRGTAFYVEVLADRSTRVVVKEGIVAVSLRGDEKKAIEVRPNQKVHIAKAKVSTPEKITPRESKLLEKTDKIVVEAETAPHDLHDALKAANPRYNGRGKFTMEFGKIVSADLSNTGVTDIAPLKGLPLRSLMLSSTSVSDLSPLRGMPLTRLGLMSMPALTDLTPLRGMQLTQLTISASPVRDIMPLRGMPLKSLRMMYVRVQDLNPLRGMPLTILSVSPKYVKKGMDAVRGIKSLRLVATNADEWTKRQTAARFWRNYDAGLYGKPAAVAAVQPPKQPVEKKAPAEPAKQPAPVVPAGPFDTPEKLHGALKTANPQYDGKGDFTVEDGKITKVMLYGRKISDISPLKDLPLTLLNLPSTKITDISVLKGMPLKFLYLKGSPVTDVSALKGMPLVSLGLQNTKVSDISPLKDLSLAGLYLDGTDVADLGPLRGMPLTALGISGTKVVDLTPLEGMPLEKLLFTPENIKTGLDVVRNMQSLQVVAANDDDWRKRQSAADFWKKHGGMAVAEVPAGKEPGATITTPAQLHAALKAANPKYNGKGKFNVEDGHIVKVNLIETGVQNITPLTDLPLTSVELSLTKVSDIRALKGMPLTRLGLGESQVNDITPLEGAPLTHLGLLHTRVTDISVLKTMPLQALVLTPENVTKGMEVIRNMESLKIIATNRREMDSQQTAESFWKKYDAGEYGDPERAAVKAEGLVAHFAFEEKTGRTFRDVSGNAWVARLQTDQGSLSPDVPFAAGNRSSLDLTADGSVLVDPTAALRIAGDLTISFWLKIKELRGGNLKSVLLACTSPGETEDTNDPYAIVLRSTGKTAATLRILHEYGAGRNETADFGPELGIGRWRHILFVRDATRRQYTLYLDGRKQGDKRYATAPTGGEKTQLVVGPPVAAAGYVAPSALFDDIRIYNRALPEAQVKELSRAVTGNMVFIKGGTFPMGSDKGEADEKPVHKVTISDFWMGKHEVTVGEFRQFVEETDYKTTAEHRGSAYAWDGSKNHKVEGVNWRSPGFKQTDGHPVVFVSWLDAARYCDWLRRKSGKRPIYGAYYGDAGDSSPIDGRVQGYRLPTEAEWEYACRAGTTTKYYTGDAGASLNRAGWYQENSGGKTHPVGQKEPNMYGLYDMHGNVWEWCQDWYGAYAGNTVVDPMGSRTGVHGVLRGGCWSLRADDARCANREHNALINSYSSLGFRIVLTLEKKQRGGPQELQGTWEGRAVGSGRIRIVIAGNRMDLLQLDNNKRFAGDITHGAGNPARMDVLMREPAGAAFAGKMKLGIYKLEATTLTIAFAWAGEPKRPVNFDPAGAESILVLTKKGGGAVPQQLQGTWSGRDLGNADKIRVVIGANHMELTETRSKKRYAGPVIHRPGNPAEMDFLLRESAHRPWKDKTSLMIYKLQGNTLTIAANVAGNPPKRPSDFKPGGNEGQVFLLTKEAGGGKAELKPGTSITTPAQLHAALKAANPKYNGKGKFNVEGGKIVQVDLRGTSVSDITPLRGLPLTSLLINGTDVADISPIKGMRLNRLGLGGTRVSDLSPVKGMLLTRLFFGGTRVSDLSPLKGMPFTSLDMPGTRVADLSPLTGMPLSHLGISWCKNITDLSPLKGMPLTELWMSALPKVTDISLLKGMPLTQLFLSESPIVDLSVVEGMPLKWIDLPPRIDKGIEIIRGIKTLEVIVTTKEAVEDRAKTEAYWRKNNTAEQFWKRFDAGEFGEAMQKGK
ncbi:SUMF1/EgtB/PvdO family nonheme iron enzyme [Verrucomicrobiota bacterium]